MEASPHYFLFGGMHFLHDSYSYSTNAHLEIVALLLSTFIPFYSTIRVFLYLQLWSIQHNTLLSLTLCQLVFSFYFTLSPRRILSCISAIIIGILFQNLYVAITSNSTFNFIPSSYFIFLTLLLCVQQYGW